MMNLPKITIKSITQETIKSGFLGIDRRKIQFTYPDESIDEMVIDSVIKNSNDAVVIVAYYKYNDFIYIYLRSCLRPSLGFRNFIEDSGRAERSDSHILFELPAGLVDYNERGEDGLIAAAKRELLEEIGIDAPKSKFKKLGSRTFSSAGMTAERIFYFEVEVNPNTKGIPLEDGSPLEKFGTIESIKLNDLLLSIDNEEILDAKTQLGIMRFARKNIQNT